MYQRFADTDSTPRKPEAAKQGERKAMKITITGGMGFIGHTLATHLRALGHTVCATDIHATDPAEIADVMDPHDCARICRDADVVFHSAAIHNANKSIADPVAMIALNTQGTINMLQAAISAGSRRFVLMSTAKVYGEPQGAGSRESDVPLPRDPYALSKLCGEGYLERYHRDSGLDCVALRPFSVYGPGQDLGTGYVGMLINGLLNGEPVSLPGQPEYCRDFVHIQDVVELCTHLVDGSPQGFSILNAGAGVSLSLADLIELFAECSGERVQVNFRNPSPGTIVDTLGNMEYAEKLFGYTPAIDIRTGLIESLAWFRKRKQNQQGMRA